MPRRWYRLRSLTGVLLRMQWLVRMLSMQRRSLGLLCLLGLLLVLMIHDGCLSGDLAGRELAMARGAELG